MRGTPEQDPYARMLLVRPASGKFFVFWANEQPPSRVSAMALRHNVQSQQRQRHAISQEGFTTKRRGTKPPTSPRDRTSPPQIKAKKNKKQKNRRRSAHYRNKATCAVDQLRTPSARKPQKVTQNTNNKSKRDPGK